MTDLTPPPDAPAAGPGEISGHAGELAVAVARAHGVETMFTLSGAHVFPMYDGAVKADPPMRLLDVRHEIEHLLGAVGDVSGRFEAWHANYLANDSGLSDPDGPAANWRTWGRASCARLPLGP